MTTALTERTSETSQPHDVFVSYARADQAFVRRLTEALAEKGKRAWVDWADIPPTAEWMAEIRAAIDAADTYVVVLSPSSISSKVCAAELDSALMANKRIVPVLAVPVQDELVPPEVGKLNWVSFTEGFEPALAKLLQALDTDLDHVKEHTRLLVRAREWDAKDENKALLVRGRGLSEAEAWLSAAGAKEPHPTSLQTRYLLASRKAATRRQRGAITGVTAMFLVAALFAGVAVQQRDVAVRNQALARSGELAAQAEVQLTVDPQQSLRLALQATTLAPTDSAVEALRHSISVDHLKLILTAGAGELRSAAYSRDGRFILTAGRSVRAVDPSVRIWDALTGQSITGLEGAFFPAVFSPDGRLVAAEYKGGVGVWDWRAGSPPLKLRLAEASSLAFSGDGSLLVATSLAGTARIWQISTGDVVDSYPAATAAALSPTGQQVVVADLYPSGASNVIARVYSVADGRLQASLRGHAGDGISSVVFSPDGQRVLTTSYDATARLWDPSTGRELVTEREDSGVLTGAFSPDGRLVATGGVDGTLRVWDSRSGKTLAVAPAHSDEIRDLAFSGDGRYLLSASKDSNVRIWDPRTGQLLTQLLGHTDAVNSAGFSPDGVSVLTASDDGTARVWDAGTRYLTLLHDDGYPAAAMDPNGRSVVTGGSHGGVDVWTLDGRLLQTLPGAQQDVDSVTFNSTGQRFATGSADGTVAVWNAASQKLIFQTPSLTQDVLTVAFSPDGQRLVTPDARSQGRYSAYVWDASSGMPLLHLKGGHFYGQGVLYSPDGRWIVAWDCCADVGVWDATTGKLAYVLPLEPQPQGTVAAFSPDSRLLATGGYDQTVQVWDVGTSQMVRQISGHSGPIRSVSWSPDGRQILTASDDKTARIWDAETGDAVAVLGGSTSGVLAARFSPDGLWVLVASGRSVLVFDAATGGEVAKLATYSTPATSAVWSSDGRSILSAAQDGAVEIAHCVACVSLEDLQSLARSMLVD